MYLIDNLGNRYDHIATNGAANLGSNVFQGPPTPVTGTFVFSAPLPGAAVFSFYDDDQQVVISDIRLIAPAP